MKLRELVEKALSDYRDRRGASIMAMVPLHYERQHLGDVKNHLGRAPSPVPGVCRTGVLLAL